MARVVADHVRELVVAGLSMMSPLEGRRRTNEVDVHLVRLQLHFRSRTTRDAILVAVHEAGARLDIQPRVFLLDRLQLARGVDAMSQLPGF